MDRDSTTTTITPDLPKVPPGSSSMVWRLHVVKCPDPAHAGRVVRMPMAPWTVGRKAAGLQLDDPALSRDQLLVHPDLSGVWLRDLDSRNGTWAGGQPVRQARLGDGAVVRLGGTVLVLEADAGTALQYADPTPNLPGRTERARLTRFDVALAAEQPLHVLLVGETGTGKEHAAAEIHRLSRRTGPIVRMNVAAVPSELFESELFGHVAGAFTGATAARMGRVREANHGTLVLDEIGDLPAHLQPKLLRVLEENLVRPVGGSADLRVDVRFVASTNADLETLVREGRFRRDLLARLRSNTVHLTPLRDRRADVLEFADVVLPLVDGRPPKMWADRLTTEAAEAVLLHNWLDNLRSLRGALSRARALAGRDPVGLEHLPDDLIRKVAVARPEATLTPTEARRPPPAHLRDALRRHHGRVEALAHEFGVHRRQVYRWLTYAGIGADEIEGFRAG
ncbi:MAG: sigma 54-interacting transcriptional regulator [Deltaproteobacteria bacterium]|nr:sigma 54-interacting transcriptional regulator [Deltaproteobacteria bacterium]